MRPRFRPLSLVLSILSACQRTQADTSPFTTMPPATSEPAASSSTGTTSSSGSGSEASTTTGDLSTSSTGSESSSTTLILDVGPDTDLGDGKPIGCKGKIDFLFVISRYGGMAGFQAQLLDAFPKFIDTIEAKFSDFDYHIMVVDGGRIWGLDTCEEACPMPCQVPGYPCDYTPTTCDQTMGAGVVFPAGGFASNQLCKIDGGRRYMVKGQTNLKDTFACAARVGGSGVAAIGEALLTAVQPALNAPGGCNAGFLREDALLMVTLIANTYDEGWDPVTSQQGTPVTWMDAVRTAKHGDLDSVVLLSILRAYPECHEKDRTCQMVKMFPYHLLADRDELDYSPFFDEATDLVATACAEFIPPG
jgi:hypothetical protein